MILVALDCAPDKTGDLMGFAFKRQVVGGPPTDWLKGFKVFKKLEPDPKPNMQYSTFENPIQSFLWSDFTAQPDTEYEFTIAAMYGQPGSLQPQDTLTFKIRTEKADDGKNGIWFNRGSVASQAFAREFDNAAMTDEIANDPKNKMTIWLSWGLLEACLSFIDDTPAGDGLRVCAYEFTYPPVLNAPESRTPTRRGRANHLSQDFGERFCHQQHRHTQEQEWQAGSDRANAAENSTQQIHRPVREGPQTGVGLDRFDQFHSIWIPGADEYRPSGHQAQIPFDRVRNALLAAAQLGLTYDVAVCTENENDPAHLRLVSQLEEVVDRDRINTIITFPGGRALARVKSFDYSMTTECPATACTGASTPTIFPDGRVFACIGPVIDLHTRHPMLLGNLRETPLAELLDAAEGSTALHLLRVWGPGRLMTFDQRGYSGKLPKLFVKNGMCNLCYALMSEPDLCAAMEELSRDAELAEKTAHARLYYLSENTMLERMGLA